MTDPRTLRPRREAASTRAPGSARRAPHNAWTARRAVAVRTAIEALAPDQEPVAVAGVTLRGLPQSVRAGRLAALERGDHETADALTALLAVALARGEKRRALWGAPQEARITRPEQREGMA